MYADDAIISFVSALALTIVATVTAAASANEKGTGDFRFIDIIHKMGIEDIQPFLIDTRNHKSLED